jgi:hypothetical protein
MNFTRRGFVAAIAVGLALENRTSVAAERELFDGITKLVERFSRLNNQFYQIVAMDQREQLARSIDRLRVQLYVLEADTQILLDGIPNEPPRGETELQLTAFANQTCARSAGRGAM